MAALQVKFYRGLEVGYIDPSGVKASGADVAFRSEYTGAIYYATDKKVVYVDGVRYGYDATSGTGVPGAFIAVNYVAPTSSSNAKLQFTNIDGTTDEVELFKITSSTNAIDVQYNANTKAYEVGLKIANDDQALTQDGATGLKINLTMSYDHNAKKLKLYGKKDNQNTDIMISEIDTTDFVRDGMIKNVSIVNADDQGHTGRYLKIEWNSDAGESTYPEHEGLDPSVGNDLVTYVDLADFFSVISSDSSAIKIDEDYVIRLIVKSSNYLSIDNGVSGQGLSFDDNAIDSQFTDIKNVSINGHTIDDSIADSSLLIVATEIPIGSLTNRDSISDTSINTTDSVELAIAKLNKALSSTAAGVQAELDRTQSAIGLNSDGTMPSVQDSSWLKNTNGTEPANFLAAAKNLDKHVAFIDQQIEEMDFPGDGESQEQGDFTVAVTQTNGKVSASRGWTAEQALHGYTTPDNGSYGASTSIKSAIEGLDNALSWHIVAGS